MYSLMSNMIVIICQLISRADNSLSGLSRQQYNIITMLTELKEAKQRKKQAQLQLRAEEHLAQATRVWTREILPKWEQM